MDPIATQYSKGYNFNLQKELQQLQNTTFQMSNFNTEELSYEDSSVTNFNQTKRNGKLLAVKKLSN